MLYLHGCQQIAHSVPGQSSLVVFPDSQAVLSDRPALGVLD